VAVVKIFDIDWRRNVCQVVTRIPLPNVAAACRCRTWSSQRKLLVPTPLGAPYPQCHGTEVVNPLTIVAQLASLRDKIADSSGLTEGAPVWKPSSFSTIACGKFSDGLPGFWYRDCRL